MVKSTAIDKIFLDKFKTAYLNARLFIKDGDSKNARLYVCNMLEMMKTIYANSKTYHEKFVIQKTIMKWIEVSADLRTKGITEKVISVFNINVTKQDSVEDKSKFESNDFENIIEELTRNDQSQGWCADVFVTAKKSVLKVSSNTSSTKSKGTGFLITRNGYFLTNHHVISNTLNKDVEIKVSFEENNKEYSAKIIASSEEHDVALCKILQNETFEYFIKFISDVNLLLQGADILVIGNGFSMGIAPFTGTLKYVHNSLGDMVYTAPSNPGDSGGPVLNRNGLCIGINKSITASVRSGNQTVEAQGLTNATPADIIIHLLAEWKEKYNLDL